GLQRVANFLRGAFARTVDRLHHNVQGVITRCRVLARHFVVGFFVFLNKSLVLGAIDGVGIRNGGVNAFGSVTGQLHEVGRSPATYAKTLAFQTHFLHLLEQNRTVLGFGRNEHAIGFLGTHSGQQGVEVCSAVVEIQLGAGFTTRSFDLLGEFVDTAAAPVAV